MQIFFRNLYFECIFIFLISFESLHSFAVIPFISDGRYFHILLYSYISFQAKTDNGNDSLSADARLCNACMDKSIDDSDMILHLQLKVDNSLEGQVKDYLERENILCAVKKTELGLLFTQQKTIAVSQKLCPICFSEINKSNLKQSKGITGCKTIPLPIEFNVHLSDIKAKFQQHESKRSQESRISPDIHEINSYLSSFNDYLTLSDEAIQEKLKSFPNYTKLSNFFLGSEIVSSKGFLSYPPEGKASIRIIYVDIPRNKGGYFVIISESQPKSYKVIINNDPTKQKLVVKVPCAGRSQADILKDFKREWRMQKKRSQLDAKRNELFDLDAKRNELFDLSTLLAALDIKDG